MRENLSVSSLGAYRAHVSYVGLSLFLASLLFVMFCALLFSVLYANVLSGGLVLAFALLVTIMLMVISFLALMMVRTSRQELLQLRHASVVDREEPEVGCSDLGDAPIAVGFDRIETVRCIFRSGRNGGFEVRCYNASCPRLRFPDGDERI